MSSGKLIARAIVFPVACIIFGFALLYVAIEEGLSWWLDRIENALRRRAKP